MSGDNGGPVYWTDLGPIYAHGGSANNFPLKGGKSSVLEGGVRVSAFATGGMIPPAMRGTVLGDTTHAIQLADWSAASVCRLHRDTQRDRDRQTVSDRVTAASPPPPGLTRTVCICVVSFGFTSRYHTFCALAGVNCARLSATDSLIVTVVIVPSLLWISLCLAARRLGRTCKSSEQHGQSRTYSRVILLAY